MSDSEFGDVYMQIIEDSLVCQWNPNFVSAILLDEDDDKVDESSNQETYVVNTKDEMERYESVANPFVRLWPYYESSFFIQQKEWDDEDEWTTKEYKLEPLGFFSNQQFVTLERTLNFPSYKYTSMYANSYDMVIFTYQDPDNRDQADQFIDIFQIYQCYSEGDTCKKHYEYSIEDDLENKQKLRFANQYVTWERSTDMHEVIYLTQHKDTNEIFMTYLRLYLKWDDPIVFQLNEIPLRQDPHDKNSNPLTTLPKLISEYDGNLLVQL